MTKNEYVINNGFAITTKQRSILGPGKEITLDDFQGNKEKFEKLLNDEKIILKDDFIPEEKDDNKLSINLRYAEVSLEVKKEIIDYIEELSKEIPKNRLKQFEIQKKVLINSALDNYRAVGNFLNNMSFQKARIPKQQLDSSKRFIKHRLEEFTYIPEPRRVII